MNATMTSTKATLWPCDVGATLAAHNGQRFYPHATLEDYMTHLQVGGWFAFGFVLFVMGWSLAGCALMVQF
jgi:hypothetical protein